MNTNFKLYTTTALLSLLTSFANAAKIEVGGIFYNLTGANTAEVTYRGEEEDGWMYFSADNLYTGDVSIPDSFRYEGNTYRVTAIGKDAFAGSKYMETLHLPASVGNMGSGLFTLCSSLSSISVDEGNSRWLSHAGIMYQKAADQVVFYFAPRSISEVEFYEGIAEIPASAFQHNKAITSVTIPETVTSIGDCAFDNCSNLQSVTIGSNVRTIGQYAFSKNPSLDRIDIPASVKAIAPLAFSNCDNLYFAVFHDGLETIGKMAFFSCGSLMGVELPGSLKTIEESAFEGCENLGAVRNHSKLNIVAGSTANGYVGYYASSEGVENMGASSGICNVSSSAQAHVSYLPGGWAAISNMGGANYIVFGFDGRVLLRGTCGSDFELVQLPGGRGIVRLVQ